MPLKPNSQPFGRQAAGLLVVEVVLALAIGLMLLGQIAQTVLQETGHARRFGRLLRERLVTDRALELMRSEVKQALTVSLQPPVAGHEGCGLSGRRVVLQLQTVEGLIVYSVEARPDAIWRGQALMRCGPSYALTGQLNSTDLRSRVLLDALAPGSGVITQLGQDQQLAINLERHFAEPGQPALKISSTATMAAPGLAVIP